MYMSQGKPRLGRVRIFYMGTCAVACRPPQCVSWHVAATYLGDSVLVVCLGLNVVAVASQ